MTMSIKTANFRLKLQMKTFIYTFNAFNLHLSFPCNSILKFWMYTSWLLSWLIRGEMDNFNQVGATKFCFVAKVFPSKLIFFSSRMLWTLWRPWVWTPGSRKWSTWPTRSASTASSTTRTSASSSSGSTARRTRRSSTRHFSRFPLHLSTSAEMIRDISQVICGTDPYPQNFRAKKWKIKDKYFTKADFQFMMRNLPVPVNEEDIDQMFEFADKDKDGRINYRCYKWFIIK